MPFLGVPHLFTSFFKAESQDAMAKTTEGDSKGEMRYIEICYTFVTSQSLSVSGVLSDKMRRIILLPTLNTSRAPQQTLHPWSHRTPISPMPLLPSRTYYPGTALT